MKIHFYPTLVLLSDIDISVSKKQRTISACVLHDPPQNTMVQGSESNLLNG